MRKFFYTFSQGEIDKFKHCPICGSTFMSVYEGDHDGMIQCYDCPEDMDDIHFTLSYKDDLLEHLLDNSRPMTKEEHKAHYDALMKLSKPTGRNIYDTMGWVKDEQDTDSKKSD